MSEISDRKKISENFCTPASALLQGLTNRMVNKFFENLKFLSLKIAFKNEFIMNLFIYGQNFLKAIFSGKNFEF